VSGYVFISYINPEWIRASRNTTIDGYASINYNSESYNSFLTHEGVVHGGLILSLTDTLGSLVVASKGHFMTGVSTDIGTSFVRAAGGTGDVLYAKAVLAGMGEQSRF
jgi:acyl-coenzyme A thioesterase 13